MHLKQYVPSGVKDTLRRYPTLANVIDRLSIGRRREIPVFTDIPTMLSGDESELLFQLAKANNPEAGKIVEIGCYAGGSTYFLGKGAEISDSRVYSVDPFNSYLEQQMKECDGSPYLGNSNIKPSREEVQETMRKHGLDGRVELIQGFSTDIASRRRYIGISMMFIDGNHGKVYDDYTAWRKHFSGNATIAFHDTNYPSYGRKDTSEVVEEFIKNDGLEVIKRVDSMTVVRFC